LAKRKKIYGGLRKAGGFIGIKSVKDVGQVAVTSAGSNYFANVLASALGNVGGSRFIRPVIAGLIAVLISRKQLRTASVVGSMLIGLSQAGVIGSLGGIGRTVSGTNNPPRGQQAMNQPNILGRLP
jgi:hypothetical protein